MAEHEWLAEQFEAKRPHLRAVAYRMLGSASEADDAVQEAWLRLSRADTSGVDNLGGWLTTVVARVCLDALRSRKSRREESLDADVLEQPAAAESMAMPSMKCCSPIPSAWRCSSSSRRWIPPNASPSCCTTCSICRSTRLRRSSAARRSRRDSSRAARGGACGARRRFRTATSRDRRKWSRRSWRPRATAT